MTKPTIKERVKEIAALRDRTGLPPLDNEARVQLLNEIYDGLLYLWKQCVLTGTAGGTGALTLQIERARLEIEQLTGHMPGYSNEYDGQCVGWDYDPDQEAELLKLIPS